MANPYLHSASRTSVPDRPEESTNPYLHSASRTKATQTVQRNSHTILPSFRVYYQTVQRIDINQLAKFLPSFRIQEDSQTVQIK